MHRPPKPEIAGSNPATPAMNLDKSQKSGRFTQGRGWHGGRCRGGKQSPDPYGHGFARTENPLERTMEKWQQQEALRMRFGVVARHPATLVVRQLFGASVAIMALLSITLPSLTPPNPGYVMLFWRSRSSSRPCRPCLPAKRCGSRFKLEFHFVKSTMRPPVENSRCALNRAWIEFWKA